MTRGEVWWAILEPRSRSEQRGRRPVVVVSHDAFNETPGWMSVIVVPLSTSTARARRGPTAVALPRGSGGLKMESTALCHQVTTLDRTKLVERSGVLGARTLETVERGLRAAMDLR